MYVMNERIRILIVEDDPVMAELISDLVEAEGWTPLTAPSAEEAMGMLLRETVHLALVDHNLPGTSGRTFAQRLRAQTNIGIVMVTAAGSAADRVLGLETAADDYVVKPFEPIELTARIKAVLRRTIPWLKPERESEREHEPAALKLSDWSVDLKNRRAVCLNDPANPLPALNSPCSRSLPRRRTCPSAARLSSTDSVLRASASSTAMSTCSCCGCAARSSAIQTYRGTSRRAAARDMC
jgi:CheY-like chemotaxis protein